jgi:hypothetical protein
MRRSESKMKLQWKEKVFDDLETIDVPFIPFILLYVQE